MDGICKKKKSMVAMGTAAAALQQGREREGGEEECEVKNKRGRGGSRMSDGWRGNGEGGMEGKRLRLYQTEIFDSAESVTLARKTKAAWLASCSNFPSP